MRMTPVSGDAEASQRMESGFPFDSKVSSHGTKGARALAVIAAKRSLLVLALGLMTDGPAPIDVRDGLLAVLAEGF
jgi:hypothetical protein